MNNNKDKINRDSDIPEKYYIYDFRKMVNLKKKTFNDYSKIDVLGALQKSIIDGKLEEGCHWGTELLVSGHMMDLWDRLILINSKYISLGAPKLPFYLWSRFVQQIQICNEKRYHGEFHLQLRNNQECRNHITEIISIMALSTKHKLKTLPKISPEDFRVDYFQQKLEARDIMLIDKIIKSDDPSEINIVVNELAYQLREKTGNLEKALYWLNWLLEWEKLNLKKLKSFNCASRNRKHVKPQFYHDLIWLIWDVIFQEASFRGVGHEKCNQQLIGLFKMYRYNFTTGSKKRKIPLVTHAIYILQYEDKLKWDKPVMTNYTLVLQAVLNCNFLYLDYKKPIKEQLQKKQDSLEVITRNNYLVSDQKIQPPSNKKADLVSDKTRSQMNKVALLDQYLMNVQDKTGGSRGRYKTPKIPQKPYQKTENIIKQIEGIIN